MLTPHSSLLFVSNAFSTRHGSMMRLSHDEEATRGSYGSMKFGTWSKNTRWGTKQNSSVPVHESRQFGGLSRRFWSRRTRKRIDLELFEPRFLHFVSLRTRSRRCDARVMSLGFICDSLRRLSRPTQFRLMARVDDEEGGDSISATLPKHSAWAQTRDYDVCWCERELSYGIAMTVTLELIVRCSSCSTVSAEALPMMALHSWLLWRVAILRLCFPSFGSMEHELGWTLTDLVWALGPNQLLSDSHASHCYPHHPFACYFFVFVTPDLRPAW